jgi:hypothetical protein
MRDQRHKSDGYIRIPRMPFAVAKRTDLLHPYWRLPECLLGNPRSGDIQDLTRLRDSPRKRPSLSLR